MPRIIFLKIFSSIILSIPSNTFLNNYYLLVIKLKMNQENSEKFKYLYVNNNFYVIPFSKDLASGNEDLVDKALSNAYSQGYSGSFPVDCECCRNQPTTFDPHCRSKKENFFEFFDYKTGLIKMPINCIVLNEFYNLLEKNRRLDFYLLKEKLRLEKIPRISHIHVLKKLEKSLDDKNNAKLDNLFFL